MQVTNTQDKRRGEKRSQNALRDMSGEIMRLLSDAKGNSSLTAKQISEKLSGSKANSCDRRIHDVFNVMHAMGMIHKDKDGGIYWVGNTRAEIDQHERRLEQQTHGKIPPQYSDDTEIIELIKKKENLSEDINRKKRRLGEIFKQAGVL
eukprot:CAMPEP_0194363596 /NCGR_PEP_ID=MMETSP0174-20130528/11428_1 /TAXON_ID=216777 /ORGANISM="Proboscia alata, Strain PI-D3" /LENGTH=148 /DNA_ID=CAMNT_0039137111 /DNA_START=88 /DNA_END=534 /DNA_ORIENTATION=-